MPELDTANSFWTATLVTGTDNAIAAPDDTVTADTVCCNKCSLWRTYN